MPVSSEALLRSYEYSPEFSLRACVVFVIFVLLNLTKSRSLTLGHNINPYVRKFGSIQRVFLTYILKILGYVGKILLV